MEGIPEMGMETKPKAAAKINKLPATPKVKIEDETKPGILGARRKSPGGYATGSNGPGVSSDSSWVATGPVPVEEVSSDDELGLTRRFNANLTQEEIEMIAKMRRDKAAASEKPDKSAE